MALERQLGVDICARRNCKRYRSAMVQAFKLVVSWQENPNTQRCPGKIWSGCELSAAVNGLNGGYSRTSSWGYLLARLRIVSCSERNSETMVDTQALRVGGVD